uniref:Rx N-terminal domain-containing protein n=1 Tax=Leersia perrieri TaxID=77586 RepID=A0A0D9WV90_9ORYZ
MELVTGAMGSLLPKLGELLKEEYHLQKKVRKKVESLSRELESMHAALRKVGEVPPDQLDEQVKIWALEVRDASYDVEDIEVADRRNRYKIDDIVAKYDARSTFDPRILDAYKVTKLVGIDEPRDKIIEMLSDEKTEVVSIVGTGGLGKTTLANAVYDKLIERYHCGASVPMGQHPDLKKIFKDILFDLDQGKYGDIHNRAWDERLLIAELRGFLKHKKYDSWQIIQCALGISCGSRIITTTRKLEVATKAGCVYRIEPLSDCNSKRLFYIRIFGGDGGCLDNHLDEMHDKIILKKCGGVSLAINTLASLLVGKPREAWPEVYSSIGFGHGDKDIVKNTEKILSFSYYDLPCHLKTCLLYLSIYPEDYFIRRQNLIWIWIAEGFVHEEPGMGLFEIGESCFNELMNRSLIIPVKGIYNIVGCRVHDMVLGLIRSISSGENFVVALDDDEKQQFSRIGNVRRLALQKIDDAEEQNPDQLAAKLKSMQELRSLIAIRCHVNKVKVSFSSFQVLRVLAIERCYSMEGYHLEQIRNLIHLRYLGLRDTPVGSLPQEIGDLKILQVLNLSGTGIEELPSSIGLLTQLVSLSADEKTRVPADWIRNLTSLQQLVVKDTSPDEESRRNFLKALGNLRELRKLAFDISVLDDGTRGALVESLRSMHKIQGIDMSGISSYGMSFNWENEYGDGGLFHSPHHLQYLRLKNLQFWSLPVWMNSLLLSNLCILHLNLHVIREQDMETLGRLPQLVML